MPKFTHAALGVGYRKGTGVKMSPRMLLIFTALHGMQTRSSDENSVRLSVKRVDCDKTEERSVQIFFYHTKDHLV